MDVPKIINLNKASRDALLQVEGIDERKADDIIKMRNCKGHIDSVDELTEVEGITKSALDPMRSKLQV